MTEWKTYRLGDVCSRLRSGKGIPASEVSACGKFAVVGGNGVRGYTDKSNFNGQCVVVGRQGAYCGNVRYFDGEFYMTEHAVVIVGNEYADTHFLAYLLSIMELGHLSAQSAQPGLSVQTLSKLEISLPSLEEQRRIAGILGAIDDKIENNRRINTNLELQAQALYKQWFVDFDFPNEDGKPYKSSGGKMVDSELGPIPDGWRVGLLKDIVNFQSGFPFKSELFSEQGTYRLITIKGVQDGYLDVNGAVYIKNIPDRMPPYCLLIEGDIVMSLTGNVGRCCIVDRKNLLLNQRVVKLQPTFINSNMFIYTMFRRESFKEKLIALAKGTAQANLSPIETANMRTITPSASCLVRFNKLGQSIFKQLLKNIKENNRLAALRDTLLPKLMNGEIKM